MTFKELEFKKIKALLTPYVEFIYLNGWIYGRLKGFTLFTYFGKNMAVHYISDFSNPDVVYSWDFETCNNYFDVVRLLPKIKETFLELKHPGYHQKLKRIQDDC